MSDRGVCLVNDQLVELGNGDRGVALAWLRERRGLVGTKEGCGEGECGACTVLLGEPTASGRLAYRAVASCLLPVGELPGRHLVTVEGLNPPTGLTPVQQALVDAGAPQCGFCFPGIVMALTGFLLTSDDLSSHAATVALDGNVCRCTGYTAIRRAVDALCEHGARRLAAPGDRATQLIQWGVLPDWFATAPARLRGRDLAPRTVGGDRVVMAGGTDLIIQQPELLDDDGVAFLSRRPALATIERELDHLSLGGGVTIETLKHDPDVRDLVPDAPAIIDRFASTLIRNRATVAGNLVNASPIGDLTVLLLALDASLVLVEGGARRVLPLGEFYLGYKQLQRRPGEVIESVRIPTGVKGDAVSFEKISQRRFLDIASVNSALRARLDGPVITSATLAIGGVAPIPLVARNAAQALVGRVLDADVVREAAVALDREIAPIDDVRGTALYKRELARRVLIAHLLRLVPDRLRHEELV
ncbi:MAG: FAD binding domain-containing protein [Candidatus Krumholzibacteriia bacterium]